MDLNLVSIVYLFYRLAPFIIVCFFTLNSIINQDLRGLMYLSGLLILISVVFITSSSWLLLPLLFVNILLMGYFGLIKFLDIFKPLKIIYDAIQVILRNLIFSITTIVIIILIVGSYVLHFYEFNKIDNIDRKLNNEDTEFFYYRLVKFFKFIDFGFDDYKNESDGYCMEFSINGSEIKKPLSACIYGFTYGYLMFYINKYDLIQSNIPIVTLFPLLIVGDLAFQKVHKCRPSLSTNIVALFLGVSWGVNWGDIVASMKNASLQYFVGGNQPACSVPSSQKFVCNVYKNGQLIATQMNKS